MITQAEIRAFWLDVRRIAAEVKRWPAWKRGSVDRPQSGATSAPEEATGRRQLRACRKG